MLNLLALTVLLPLFGAGGIWAWSEGGRAAARLTALVTTLVTLGCAGWLVFHYPDGPVAFDYDWLERGVLSGVDVRFSLGLDGLSLWMFGLSALLTVTAVLVSWEAIEDRAPAFYALLLLLESGMLGVFAARDIILFYVFFEFTLIPLFFLIGIWGSEQRRHAAIKFFLYTLAGSVLTFLGLLAIVLWVFKHPAPGEAATLTFSIQALTDALSANPMSYGWQLTVFLALFAGFAIKVPLFPLHTWLPLAHVQAPTAGSVILAGILLKIGTYGFLRFSIPMLPEATAACAPWLLGLSVAGIIYGALVALAQSDIKRLIAYSSVSHMGFCLLGLFALNRLGLAGGTLQMINHGLSTGGLFAIVGMLYERYHTRDIKAYSGIARRTPCLAFFLLLMTFSSIGLPGMNGFAGEIMLLTGMFQRAWGGAPVGWETQYMVFAVLAVLGVVLGAWYMLWLVERVFFGPLKEPHVQHGEISGHAHESHVHDLNFREMAALIPLVVFVFWIGLKPGYFLEHMQPDIDRLSMPATMAMERRHAPAMLAYEADAEPRNELAATSSTVLTSSAAGPAHAP
jgi:NADH-quinone oxidoreductase subunit M